MSAGPTVGVGGVVGGRVDEGLSATLAVVKNELTGDVSDSGGTGAARASPETAPLRGGELHGAAPGPKLVGGAVVRVAYVMKKNCRGSIDLI
jgi:hypothetical protein